MVMSVKNDKLEEVSESGVVEEISESGVVEEVSESGVVEEVSEADAKKIKVFLVDDMMLVRTGIANMLADVKDIEVVGEAENGKEAISFLKNPENPHPDIVLLDLKFHNDDDDAVTITRSMLKISPELKILILTAYDDNVYPSQLLKEGVFGYLLKKSDMDDLLNAIYSANKGVKYINSEVAKDMYLKRLNNIDQDPFDVLSDRELEITKLIARGNKATKISDVLGLNPKTINTYRYRIFSKLQVSGDVQLALLALRCKLVMPEDISSKSSSKSASKSKSSSKSI